jgi:DNA-binding transcriptional LysR family regulator
VSLELNQLRTFVAVSRQGNVVRAADTLQLTASPVSRTLRELERSVGPLFDREYHRMRLTDLGRRLLPTAVRTVLQADDLVTLAHGRTPTVRYAATPWIPEEFARRLARAALDAGDAEDAEAAMSSVLLHRMEHGELDIALVHLPVRTPEIAAMAMARYQFLLAVAATDQLAQRDSVSSADLVGRTVLLPPVSMQPAAMGPLLAWLHGCGVEKITEIDLADVPMLSTKLRRRGTVSLVTADATGMIRPSPAVVTIPFARDNPEFHVGIAWRTGDPLRDERLSRIVAALRPVDGKLAAIG